MFRWMGTDDVVMSVVLASHGHVLCSDGGPDDGGATEDVFKGDIGGLSGMGTPLGVYSPIRDGDGEIWSLRAGMGMGSGAIFLCRGLERSGKTRR